MRDWLEKHVLRHTRNVCMHPLHKVAIFGLVVLTGLSFAQSTLTPFMQGQLDRMLSAILPGVIVGLTNAERTAKSLGTLERSALLDEAALLKAEHMLKNDYFAHYSPEGITPWYWFDVAKYDYIHAGENLAIYFEDSEDVIKGWMDSPLHKDNILKKEYTEIGVAAVEGKYDGYSTVFVVQLFGTPAAQAQVAPVVEPAIETKLVEATLPDTVVEPSTETVQGDTVVREEVQKKEIETPVVIEKQPDPVAPLEEAPVEISSTPTEVVQEEASIEKTLVDKVELEGDMVYLSNHISTSTGAFLGTAGFPSKKTTQISRENTLNTQTLLQTTYIFLTLLIVGLLIVSIAIAEKRLHHVQALYGVGFLAVTLAVTIFHSKVVVAATSLL